ncbi:GSCOCT00010645001.3-RA-CDS [Cotesia congregata]|uniref:Odorant binding protein 139.10646 n=1 Tax=Cotesia congregata TaxID=51543 RepID=A0A8J2EN16_COTCN|nr:GSCOCT00010645001.3-RA-CDS [Cotesia congregata]CAG5075064.1 Odorant binding protein 139.10646 [Cotesia congregata]
MYLFAVFVAAQILALQINAASVSADKHVEKFQKKCPVFPNNLEKTIDFAEKSYQSLLVSGVPEEILNKEIDRMVVCVFQHLGLIKPDNSCDAKAVVNFFKETSPYFREQLRASEKKLASFERCLSKKSESAEEARDWIINCLQKEIWLHPVDYKPKEIDEKEKNF